MDPADASSTVPRAQAGWWSAKERAKLPQCCVPHLAWFLQERVHNLKNSAGSQQQAGGEK